ncbi:hypothetical protein [Desulfocastanea catecholica]
MKKTVLITMIMIVTLIYTVSFCIASQVVTEGDRVYIVDRSGDRWDVTQARKLGFIPQKFQHGIGKNAFTPLRDEVFGDERVSGVLDTRIIGISIDDNAHAYAVSRLRHHEIANTTLAGKAIAAAY